MRLSLIIVLFFVSFSPASRTDAVNAPALINYQGRLLNQEGDVLPDGNYSLTFRIYPCELPASECDALWQEGQLITLREGMFAVLLGSIVAFPDSLFVDSVIWLGVQVGLDSELAPRTRLTSVPYAQAASFARRADTARMSLDKTTDAGELQSGVLDTALFSSYDDLLSENRIGGAADQLAPGDHAHNTGLGWFVDGDSKSLILDESMGNVVVRSVTLPADPNRSYFRVCFSGNGIYSSGDGVVYLAIEIAGQQTFAQDDLPRWGNEGKAVCYGFQQLNGRWHFSRHKDISPINMGLWYTFDMTNPVTVNVIAWIESGPGEFNVEVGPLVVEVGS